VPVRAHASFPSLDPRCLSDDVVSGEGQLDSIHSNNLLAVELESENDAARQGCDSKTFQKFSSVEAAASGDNKRIE
jgi:hypothetical protein